MGQFLQASQSFLFLAVGHLSFQDALELSPHVVSKLIKENYYNRALGAGVEEETGAESIKLGC